MTRVVQELHHMLKSTEEHRRVFPEPPFIAFRRCKNLKGILVRSKLYGEDNEASDSRGCSPCDKSRCQVCKVMCSTKQFMSNVTNKQFRINFFLIMTRLMWYICWSVVFVACSMLAAHVPRLDLDLITIRRVIVGFSRGLQGYPRPTFSGTLLEMATGVSWKMLGLLS